MDLQLQGQRVILTGASGALGQAIARGLVAEGAALALLGRDRTRLDTLTEELADLHRSRVVPVSCDLREASSTDAAIDHAVRELGGLEVLVCAAGAAQGGIFWEIDDAAWQRHLEVKLFGTIRTLRAVAPRLIAQKRGRIVLVVGNSARQPDPRLLPGAAANAALLTIVQGLAQELGPHGVSINAVNPGPVRSSRWDQLMKSAAVREGITVQEAETRALRRSALQRLATPDEIATHVVYLASPAAAHLNGTSVTVDGGSAPPL